MPLVRPVCTHVNMNRQHIEAETQWTVWQDHEHSQGFSYGIDMLYWYQFEG